MNPQATLTSINLRDLAQPFVKNPVRWLAPAAVVFVLAVAYAFTSTPTWEASQTLAVRNDAIGMQDSPGKFRHSDELKAILETVLELSKSRTVLASTLAEVGPPADYEDTAAWPTSDDIDALADAVKVAAPKGSEFGKTEVFYLKVKSKSATRAIMLADSLCRQIEAHYGKVRNSKAESTINELAETERLASADVIDSTERLKKMERNVGGDLSELRNLHQAGGGGESDLRRKGLEMSSELRQAKTKLAERQQLLQALVDAKSDHDRLLGLPNGMLESLPALRKLKDGLIDAQMKTSERLGTMSKVHPKVRAAEVAELEIAQHLNDELAAAIQGVEIDRDLAQRHVDTLVEQMAGVQNRLEELAGMRAEYSALVIEAEHRSRMLADVQRRLTESRATRASAETASLINRIDTPDVGSRPVGPSKALMLLVGMVGGLAIGTGVLLLTTPPSRPATTAQNVVPQADLGLGRELGLKGTSMGSPRAA